MKDFPAERRFAKIMLAFLLAYFAGFFVFSCIQTLYSRYAAAEKERRNIISICSAAAEISSEIPLENRDAWLASFEESPELLLLCAEKRDSSQAASESIPFVVGDSLPLSILF